MFAYTWTLDTEKAFFKQFGYFGLKTICHGGFISRE